MNKQELINSIRDVLCSDKEIEKDLKGFKKWTICKFKNSPDEWYSEGVYLWQNTRLLSEPDLFQYKSNWNVIQFNIWGLKWGQWFEIIWNPIDYRHILSYCKNKNIRMCFSPKWMQEISRWFLQEAIKVNHSKPFEEQEYEVLKQILDYLLTKKD